jgi:hypothetical protein
MLMAICRAQSLRIRTTSMSNAYVLDSPTNALLLLLQRYNINTYS